MKKLFLFLSLFLVALSYNSCTNDNDDDQTDNIVGKWRLSQVYAEINQEPMDHYMLTECEKKSTIEFFENGTYKESGFEFNDENNTCATLAPTNGTWENLGNSMYDFSGFDFSGFDISGVTFEPQVKVTFLSNKMMMEFLGTMVYAGTELDILIKVTFIENDTYVPDNIIGKWKMDQQFYNNVEENLTTCEKTMTIQFFEEGTYEEKDFELNNTQCVALAIKNGTWKSLGNNMYEISDLEVSEFKVTFSNNKMTVEFSVTELSGTISVKYVFVKVTA